MSAFCLISVTRKKKHQPFTPHIQEVWTRFPLTHFHSLASPLAHTYLWALRFPPRQQVPTCSTALPPPSSPGFLPAKCDLPMPCSRKSPHQHTPTQPPTNAHTALGLLITDQGQSLRVIQTVTKRVTMLPVLPSKYLIPATLLEPPVRSQVSL